MNEPLMPPPSPKPPPAPEYVPPPVIYPRPRHKPNFDAPLHHESYKRSTGNKVGIVLAWIVGIPIGLFALMIFFGMMLPENYGMDSKVADAKTRLEIVVGARSNGVSIAYGNFAMKSGWVWGQYIYPGSAMHIFAFDGSRLMLDGMDNMLVEPVMYCVAELGRLDREQRKGKR